MTIPHKEVLSDGIEVYLGDCRDVLPLIGRVDAVVTSPPYGQQREYGKIIDDWRSVVRVLADTPDSGETQILVNLGLIHRNGEVIPYFLDFLEDMRAAGWRHFGWYIWDQMSGMAGDWNGRLAPSYEFIFHFNRSSVSVNKTKRTLGGKQHGPNIKSADGTAVWKSHDGKEIQPFKIPDSVIRTPRETSGGPDAEHPARFPIRFANELIEPFTAYGGVVCDPFMGSGTTGVACVNLGRSFIGIEREPKYYDIARRRITEALSRPRLPFDEPAKVKQESLL